MLKATKDNPALQEQFWIASSRDVLFFLNTFGWTYDPRRTPTHVPFITYDYQDKALLHLADAIETGYDIVVEKSRDMGATWMCLAVFLHNWLFKPYYSLLVASRKEDAVDRRGDPDSLYWKLEYLLNRLPEWFCPNYNPDSHRKHLNLINPDTGSVISGESTNKDLARSGRRRAIMLDEFAAVDNGNSVLSSTRDVTPCRVFNSTPKGANNAFYRIRQVTKNVITMPWWLHPVKGKGKYRNKDNEWRSPWYDGECNRVGSVQEIAQELDIDYFASGSMFFDAGVLNRLKIECRDPFAKGEINYTLDQKGKIKEVKFQQWVGKQRLKLWLNLSPDGKPPEDRNYVLGVDVAAGTGASNSVISVADTTTKEKVAEFACSRTSPEDLAFIAVALSKWFGGQVGFGFLIWEANGPGGLIFGQQVMDLGWRYVYWRRNEMDTRRRRTAIPGWHTNRNSKQLLLGEYRAALARGDFKNFSSESIRECWDYTYLGPEEIGVVVTTDDPSGAGSAHGDRVIADALACFGLREQGRARPPGLKAPWGSFAWRKERAKKRKREREEALA